MTGDASPEPSHVRHIPHHPAPFRKSPFSEKIRLVFGLKDIAWTSVLISRIMPRPDLMPMTGGYRRTPVMQIGADIYCDTQMHPARAGAAVSTADPVPCGNQGLGWGTAMWTDRSFFQNTVNLVFGSLADKVPQNSSPTAKSCAAPSSTSRR